MTAFILDDIVRDALSVSRRTPAGGQAGRPVMRWSRGPDGRPACRWRRASVEPGG